MYFEANFDGLVGPTHNYAGLAFGNVASMSNESMVSRPREAVLQGLQKMRYVRDLGLLQGLLPPHERPFLPALRRMGFTGSDAEVVTKAARTEPRLFSAVYSSSAMWTANAATIAPSVDTSDRRVHFTAANLVSHLHRSIEGDFTSRVLQRIFANEEHFAHHAPLPSTEAMGDEGAANHTRLCANYDQPGLHFFVYGREAFSTTRPRPKRYMARQTLESCRALARMHDLKEKQVVFAQQSTEAIDAGVFHNDVAAVGNRNVYFYHERAYQEGAKAIEDLARAYREVSGQDLIAVEVPANQVSLEDSVKSYLFNSQLISLPSGEMALIAPVESQETPAVKAYLDNLLTQATPIRHVHYLDVRQSMRNGGGPACLRLRVVLNEKEKAAAHSGVFLSNELLQTLSQWGQKHYREELSPNDLADPQLMNESYRALDELTQILGLGSIYHFQR